MLTVTSITDRDTWHALLRPLPAAHVLQTWDWGDSKRGETGWTPERLAFRDGSGATVAAASVLTRRVGPLRVMYVPKGPALDYRDPALLESVLDHLEMLARQRRAVCLKIDTDIIAGTGIPGSDDRDHPPHDDPAGQRALGLLRARGWRFSASQVQFRNTLTLDLAQSGEALLAAMSQGTRRKIRQAIRGDRRAARRVLRATSTRSTRSTASPGSGRASSSARRTTTARPGRASSRRSWRRRSWPSTKGAPWPGWCCSTSAPRRGTSTA